MASIDLRAADQQALEALEPVSVTDLQQALIETNLIDPDAIDDPEGYDDGSTVAQIDALHGLLFKSQRPAKPVQEPDTCTWQQDGDSDSGLYATSCRHYFNLEDGTPEDNKLAWCCYCGKKLAQELIEEEDNT